MPEKVGRGAAVAERVRHGRRLVLRLGGREYMAAALAAAAALPAAAEEGEPAPLTLEPVVVSATRAERPLWRLPASVSVRGEAHLRRGRPLVGR